MQLTQDRRREESRCSKRVEDDTKVENDGEVCKFCEKQEAEYCEWQQYVFLSDIYPLLHGI